MPELLDFTGWSVWINAAVFACGAAVVWIAGSRMVPIVDRLAGRTGMGQGFAGMLLVGGIVSLTEISTVTTAAFTGNPLLALNNLLGSESINLFLLAASDPVSGREALTSFIARPAVLFQGTLGIVLLGVVAVAMTTGDVPVLGVGAWSSALFLLCLAGMWMSAQYQRRAPWLPADAEERLEPEQDGSAAEPGGAQGDSVARLITRLIGVGTVIFASGFLLSMSGDAIAKQTGLGTSFVGFVLVGMSTSLPELSTIVAAIRLRRYEMAIGDILGSNVYNLLLIFVVDVVYRGEPVFNQVTPFESVATLMGIVMTGILLLGLLDRRDRTVLKMGYDSAVMLVVFAGGLVLLYRLSG